MLDISMTFEDGQQRSIRAQAPLLIGRAAQCGLRIANWRVAKHHARLQGQGRMLELEDLGSLGGTLVNGTRITVHRPVLPADEILIG
ncbi:MAG TPA: FHA domain-containing protein, partial [Bordetella sp.]|nr:FHA domain-containing protein [Bordetella sp.]